MTGKKPQTVMEASWEVLNKVGGIHTVVKSKADFLAEEYEDYIMVGPLFPGRVNLEFNEVPPPDAVKETFEMLKQAGINCVYGEWVIKGRPKVILVDATQSTIDIGQVKGELWEKFQVDSLNAGSDYDDPLRWAWAVGMLIEQYQQLLQRPIVGHFHEWLAGFAGLYLKSRGAPVGTVFTTHATMLGRTICAATNISLYDDLQSINPHETAQRLGVMDKYSTEVACAQNADVFTTVSEITGIEAEHLLGRKPDVLLFNGIAVNKYPTIEEASLLHVRAREKIRDFLDFYFFSHYSFDLDQSLIFFISGRNEYHNKGYDVLTEALGKLNTELKKQDHRKTVVVFYFVPGDIHGIKVELLEERAAFTNLRQFVQEHSQDLVRKIVRNASNLDNLNCDDLLSPQARIKIEKMNQSMSHEGEPPLVTHNLAYEDQDQMLRDFRSHGLLNREEDKVKVIRYPIYLTGSDGLLDLGYMEAVAGSHLGIFPSYYEPWGYTPVEAAASAVPAVTTDLAGFGRFIQDEADKNGGIFVLKRDQRKYHDIVEDMYQYLLKFCDLDKYGRNEQKIAAKHLSALTTWSAFIKRYVEAHTKAFANHS